MCKQKLKGVKNKMRNKFSFYSSYYEMIKDLNQKQKLELLLAIIEYGLLNKEPKLTGVLKACFLGIKPNIDNDNRRYDVNFANGLKGGNPNLKNKEQQPTANRIATEQQPTANRIATEQQPTANRTATELQPNNNRNATDRQPDARAQEREKEKDIDIEKDIEKDRERKKEKDIEPTLTSGQTLSLSQKQFQKSFPKKKLDYVPHELLDMDKLITAIKQSEFLSNANNLGLRWCCEHYAEIVRGDYKDYTNPDKSVLHSREYSQKELESLIVDIDKIEI